MSPLCSKQSIQLSYPAYWHNVISYTNVPVSGGARTSRQPGHFQVTMVVRQVIRCRLGLAIVPLCHGTAPFDDYEALGPPGNVVKCFVHS